jgi:hypothetical protein
MAVQPSNPQTVKFVQQSRATVQQFIDSMNMLRQVRESQAAQLIDAANAPTQVDFDAVNAAGNSQGGIYQQQYVPVTQATWDAYSYALNAIVTAWTGGQYQSFLNYRP